MLERHSFRKVKNSRNLPWRSARLVSAVGVSLSALRFACAVFLLCGFVNVQLNAQIPTDTQQKERKKCEADVLNPPKVPPVAKPPGPAPDPEPPGNIQDGTKAALACEWNDSSGVEYVLRAFGYLTNSLPTPDPELRALTELQNGDRYPIDRGLYATAMGRDPDSGDQPTVQGLPNFLDMLAKANTLHKKKPDDESGLFDSTKDIIDEIFLTRDVPNTGPIALARINESFSRKDNYLALYQLLDSAWQGHDANDLEMLRAAFDMNLDRLAKQVAAKITAAKE
jgi:hypothetical protein